MKELKIKSRSLGKYIQTLATNSRSLFGGASTFNGVIVAVATALAAYKAWYHILAQFQPSK